MKRKKRNLALMILICLALAGCEDMNNGTAVNLKSNQMPTITPTPEELFVYGKTSTCLSDAGIGVIDDKEQATEENNVAPDQALDLEPEDTEIDFSLEQEGWGYKKIDNSMLPGNIGKDDVLFMAYVWDHRCKGSIREGEKVWICFEGYYRICLMLEDGTMYCANVDMEAMNYEAKEIPDHVKEWQDIYYVGRIDVQELITEIDQININLNYLNDESSWLASNMMPNRDVAMYVYRGEDPKEGQEIIGIHFREISDGRWYYAREKLNESHAETVIEWFMNSPLYSYWQRHMEETGKMEGE